MRNDNVNNFLAIGLNNKFRFAKMMTPIALVMLIQTT